MPSNAVAGFLPSGSGLRFANRWPSNPARVISLGPIRIPIGNTARGLCGGMAFVARDRFERGETVPPDPEPPPPGTPLFKQIVDRQFDSFGRLFSVPLRFWRAVVASQPSRDRTSVRDAWPAIKRSIDAGHPPMIGLIRAAGWNPLAVGLGHQVAGYRYEESATRVEIGIYDPNHPGDDHVSLIIDRHASGSYSLTQSTGEPFLGLLALPFDQARTG